MIIATLPVGLIQTNCYIAGCPETGQGVIIDPGGHPERILAEVERHSLTIRYVLDTHAHFDHTDANGAIVQATSAPLALHPEDLPLLRASGGAALFGLTAEEVIELKGSGYNPLGYYHSNTELKQVIDSIAFGQFSNGDREMFRSVVDSLLYHDEYLLLADYQSYIDCQERAAEAYRDKDAWTKMSILNTARCGFFSSDRTINQYCQEIWNAKPVPVDSK